MIGVVIYRKEFSFVCLYSRPDCPEGFTLQITLHSLERSDRGSCRWTVSRIRAILLAGLCEEIENCLGETG